jgi:5-methylcytosine-specific restriction protein A
MARAHYHRWYGLQSWRNRALQQLRKQPCCEACLRGGRIEAAELADHVVPHRGDRRLFDEGELQSLCRHCHASPKQSDEVRGYSREVGEDGWPIDPCHPVYKRR